MCSKEMETRKEKEGGEEPGSAATKGGCEEAARDGRKPGKFPTKS